MRTSAIAITGGSMRAAIEDMMDETSTKRAPWHLIPANNKPYGQSRPLKS